MRQTVGKRQVAREGGEGQGRRLETTRVGQYTKDRWCSKRSNISSIRSLGVGNGHCVQLLACSGADNLEHPEKLSNKGGTSIAAATGWWILLQQVRERHTSLRPDISPANQVLVCQPQQAKRELISCIPFPSGRVVFHLQALHMQARQPFLPLPPPCQICQYVILLPLSTKMSHTAFPAVQQSASPLVLPCSKDIHVLLVLLAM